MYELIIELLSWILGEAALALISIAGGWLLIKLAENKKLANIAAATHEVKDAVYDTVLELKQEFVDKWKAVNADGKLTDDEVVNLRAMLQDKVMEKLSEPAKKILIAAGKDIVAIIQGAAEALICQMKQR